MGLGELPGLPRRSGAAAAHHRHRRPGRRTIRCASTSWASARSTASTRRPRTSRRWRRLTEEALQAGAVGFTTSRTDQHKTLAGDLVPGRYAEHEELIAIGRAMGRAGRGTFGMLSDFEDEAAEFGWMRQVAQGQRPAGLVPAHRPQLRPAALAPPDGRRARRPCRQAAAVRPGRGAAGRADPGPRHVAQPLRPARGLSPSWPSCRRRRCWPSCARPRCAALILSQEASPRLLEVLPPLSRQIATRWDRMYPLGDPPDYEPPPERSIAALAAREGVSPAEYCYDYLVGGDGNRMVYLPGHQLRARRPRGGARADRGPAHHARPVRRRRALRRDLRCLAQHHDAGPLGARPHARARACRWSSSSSA